MALSDIRTEVRIVVDKIRPFATSDIDAAVNDYYRTHAWLQLSKVASRLTRKTESLALVAATGNYTLAATDFYRPIYIQPPDANINGKKFTFVQEGMEFHQHTDDSDVWVAQRGEKTFYFRPIPTANLTVTFHYVYKPAKLTASTDAAVVFDDVVLAYGAIWQLLESISMADSDRWAQRAQLKLDQALHIYDEYANDSGLVIAPDGGPWV